jgi:hypothetical protein
MSKLKITANINVKRINKARIKTKAGKDGAYLDLCFIEREDQYGNAGFVCEGLSRDEREAGEKGNIIGNWRYVGEKPASKPARQTPPPDMEDDDIPF